MSAVRIRHGMITNRSAEQFLPGRFADLRRPAGSHGTGPAVLTYSDLVQPLQQPGAGAQASESGEAPPKKGKRVAPS